MQCIQGTKVLCFNYRFLLSCLLLSLLFFLLLLCSVLFLWCFFSSAFSISWIHCSLVSAQPQSSGYLWAFCFVGGGGHCKIASKTPGCASAFDVGQNAYSQSAYLGSADSMKHAWKRCTLAAMKVVGWGGSELAGLSSVQPSFHGVQKGTLLNCTRGCSPLRQLQNCSCSSVNGVYSSCTRAPDGVGNEHFIYPSFLEYAQKINGATDV